MENFFLKIAFSMFFASPVWLISLILFGPLGIPQMANVLYFIGVVMVLYILRNE